MGIRPSVARKDESVFRPDTTRRSLQVRLAHRTADVFVRQLPNDVPFRKVRYVASHNNPSARGRWQELWHFASCPKHGSVWISVGSRWCHGCGLSLDPTNLSKPKFELWLDVPADQLTLWTDKERQEQIDRYHTEDTILVRTDPSEFVRARAQEEFDALRNRVMRDYKAVMSALGDIISDLPGFASEWPKIHCLGSVELEDLERRRPNSADKFRQHREICNLDAACRLGPVFFIVSSSGARFVLHGQGEPLSAFDKALYDLFVAATTGASTSFARISEFRRLLALNCHPQLISMFLDSLEDRHHP